MKKIIIISILIIMCISSINLGYCDEGTISVCNIQSYSISSDDAFSIIFLPCSGDAQSLHLNIVNPLSLQVERSYQLGSLIKDPHIMNLETSIIIALSELDGNSSTEEGLLVEIDYATGATIRSLNLDKSPRAMVIDSTETFAYIAMGVRKYADIPPKIAKVSLSSFQIVDEVTFGAGVMGMEITPDGSKLYIHTDNIYPDYPSIGVWGIGVFRTSDMEMLTRFTMPTYPSHLEMSADGSLLFLSSHNYEENDEGADLYIVDTSTDTITQKLRFFHNGLETGTTNLTYSSQNNKLYCTAAPKVDYAFRYSNLILELDLTDYSYTFFEMGDNPLGRIALAPLATGGRLFAIESGTPIVHYKDVY